MRSKTGILSAIGNDHRSLRPSRRKSIDPNVMCGIFDGRYASQTMNAALRGGIRAHPARTGQGSYRRGVANRASASSLDHRQFILHTEKDATEIDLQDFFEITGGIIFNAMGSARYARVVE